MRNIFRLTIQAILTIGLLTILTVVSATAATRKVTKTLDTNDGVCNADCSLREAIAVASNDDVIIFASPLFDSPQTINLGTQLFVNKRITISGKGANLLTIRAGAVGFRDFAVSSPGVLTLTGMTVRDGNMSDEGGAFFVNQFAKLYLTDCFITENKSGSAGSAIEMRFSSTVRIDRSTISANEVTTASTSLESGAIHNVGGSLVVLSSTISGNLSSLGTGGIWSNGVLAIGYSTIVNNTASGIVAADGTAAINSSIIAKNQTVSTVPDVVGIFTSNGYNLVGIVGAATGFGIAGDQIGTSAMPLDPLLNPLTNNGGRTPTHRVQDNSPAIDKGKNFLVATDQRGLPRVIDNPFVPNASGDGTDIGAFELQSQPPLANADFYTVVRNNSITVAAPGILANDVQYDGGALTAVKITNPTNGNLAFNANGGFIYVPNSNFSGIDSFTCKATNGPQDSNIVTVTLTVVGENARVVTKLEDTDDGVCNTDCSLREAITTANPGDTVEFVSPLFDTAQTLILSDDFNEQGLLINKSITINGRGTNLLTVSRNLGGASFRIFNVFGSGVNATIRGMIIRDGRAVTASGAGISISEGANLTVADSLITENGASSTIAINGGGAISVFENSSLTLVNSTVANNNISGFVRGGGGIFNAGSLNVVNSTISGNVAENTNSGGGIWTNGTTTISNSTIADNDATSTGGVDGVLQTGGTTTVRSSIIAAGRANGSTPDVGGVFVSSGYNLVGNVGTATGFNGAGDQIGTSISILNPSLDALGNYGGATPTHRLQLISPAIDGGNSFGLTTDQRGAARPVDFPQFTNASDGTDSGAFEVQNLAPVAGADSYSTGKNIALTVNAPGVLGNDSDTEGSTLTAILLTNPIHGTLVLNADGSFTYTPNANYTGSDSFTYKTNDGLADSNSATVTLSIVNNAPTAGNNAYLTQQNFALTVAAPGVLNNDTDVNGDPLTAILVTNPAHGAVTLNANGGFTYTPGGGYIGGDSFTYKANDGANDSNVATVTISINSPVTLTVTKTADTNDGVCDADCSLREAITVANQGDTIVFASPLFDSPQIITLTNANGFRDLVINKSLTINGKGAKLLTVRRNPAATTHRIFNLNGNGVSVNLSNLTMTGGDVATLNGGAINANTGVTVTLTNAHITGSKAGNGGGLYITSDSNLTLINSTVSANIANFGTSGGGGIYNEGTLNIVNSTISGNVKSGGNSNGGGVWNNGAVTISNSTIADNQAAGTNSAGGFYGAGGTATIRSSIISANRNNSTVPDITGIFTSAGFNLFGNTVNPLLNPLADNGGDTPTQNLQANSPAIDKGASFGLTTDQRGFLRVVDNINVANASDGADIGAFEATAPALVVTKIADTNDGVCNADCSLREAIAAAGTGNTVEFSALFNTSQTITLSGAAGFHELTVNKSLIINGKGANLTTVRRNGGATFRVFTIGDSNINTNPFISLTGLTITGGLATGSVGGGGIGQFSGDLTVTNCHITGNTASNGGGGILIQAGTARIQNSTISGNTTNGGGGGIYNGGTLNVVNSTVSGNVSNGGGGGILSNGAAINISNSTITDNQAATDAGGFYNQRGTATIRNTIIAGNRNNATQPDVFRGTPMTGDSFIISNDYNLIGNFGNVENFTQPHDLRGDSNVQRNPRLQPLALNGGSTPTHALFADSPAIDAGDSSGLTTDQRGNPRPIDHPAVTNASDGADIGAFESPLFAPLVVTKIADTNDGVCDADCSLREAIASTNGNEIVFSSLFDTPQIITLSTAAGFRDLIINRSLTINGKGANLLTVRRNGGGAFRVFTIGDTDLGTNRFITLKGLTITGGGGVGGGGGSPGGGGIAQSGDDLTVTNCYITGNTASNGGGILIAGTARIQNSTISGNTSSGVGGGINNSGNLTVVNSTISGNVSTVSTSDGGGGIYSGSPTGSAILNISSSTITDNQTATAASAGGFYNGNGAATIRNTIIAGNRNNAIQPDVFLLPPTSESQISVINSSGYNLIGNRGAVTAFNQTGDQAGTSASIINPFLDTLALYGGAIPTHRLLGTISPALDKGNSFGLTTDERGRTRPFDNLGVVNAIGGDGSDIGAYESQTSQADDIPVANPDSYLTDEDTILNVAAPGVLANDTDSDAVSLTAVIAQNPTHGTLALNADGSFTYTPNANYNGTDLFRYFANDGQVNSSVGTVNLTINAVNIAPTAVADIYSTPQNIALTVNAPGVLANDTDADGNALTAILVTSPAHGTLTLAANGSFIYTPTTDYNGGDSFTYKANDGAADSNTVSVSLTVTALNTRTVTKTADTNDGVCDTDCSLREAIAAASSGDTVEFASPLFDTEQFINLSSTSGFQTLLVNKSLTINGRSAKLLTVRRDPATTISFRVFNITGGGGAVNLNNLTIANGSTTSFNGGAIFANGGVSLTLTDTHITGNRASLGGGLFIASGSSLNLISCTVSNNLAVSSDFRGGGGIHNEGLLTVTNSTISGNTKSASSFNGGGVFTTNSATIVNSTITDNLANGNNSGGGVFVNGGTATIRNSIIAGNRNNATQPDVSGAFTSSGYNLVGNVGTATGFGATGDQLGAISAVLNPQLSVLNDFGGATPTHALYYNSPAIDAADLLNPLAFDQRGVERSIDGHADIGAFETNFLFSNTPTGGGGNGTLPNGATNQTYGNIQFSAIRAANGPAYTENKKQSNANLLPPYNFTVIAGSLPPGLTLNSMTGILSGIPTLAGTYNFTLKVTDFGDGMGGAQPYVLNVFGPTAATVTISGRVLTADGNGLRNAWVTVTNQSGEAQTVLTTTFGNYRFTNISAGETVVITVTSKRNVFAPLVVNVSESITELNITSETQDVAPSGN